MSRHPAGEVRGSLSGPLFLSMGVDGTKNNRVRSTVGSVRLII